MTRECVSDVLGRCVTDVGKLGEGQEEMKLGCVIDVKELSDNEEKVNFVHPVANKPL